MSHAKLSVEVAILLSPRVIAEDSSEWRSRTYSRPIHLPKIDPAGFMRVKINIALRKRTLSPVRLVLEESSKRSAMLLVVASL